GKVLLEGVAVLPEGVLGLVDIYLSAPTDGDFDGDGVPDSVDEDDDNDGCIDAFDAFDLDPAFCLDTDEDGIANEIDDDDDGDGLPDSEEVSEGADGWVTSPLVADTDDDGYRDALDVCPTVPDDQTDSDGDGIGDACDDDELPPTGYPDPVIDRFSPTEAGVGTVLTIHGSFLDDPVNVPPLIQLRFLGQTGGSGVLSGPPLAVSPGQLQFEVPPGATTGLLQLFTHGRSTTSTSALIILPSPDVVTMSPASGRRGSRVVVLGHSFLEDDLAAYVNGVQATLLPFASGALVETRVQAGQLYDALQLEVPDTVTGPLEIRNRFGFDQAPAPFEITDAGIVIDLVNPNPAAAGGQISLLGHGFSTRDLVAPPVPEVIFNYGGAELRQPLNPDWSDTQATVMVPSGVTTGPIALAHPGAASPVVYRDTLQVVPDLPYVIDADPLLVSPGDSLTLIGGNLAGVTTVTLGGGVTVGGAGLITSAGSVQLTVPAGVQPGPVTVQGPSGAGTSPFRLGVVVVSATVPLSGLGTVKAGGGFGPGASEFYLVIRPLTGSDFIQVVTATSATPGLARQLPPPAGAEGERFLSLSIAPSGTVGILQTLQDRTFVVTIPGFQTIGVCPYGRSANLLEPKFGYDPTNTVAFGLLPYQGSEGVLRIDLGTGGCERLVTLPQAAPTTNSLYGVLPLSAGSLLVTHSILGAAILDVDLQSPLYGTLTTPWTAPAIPPSRLLRGPGTAVFLEGAQAGLGYFEPLAGTPPQFFTGLGSYARGLADGAQRYLLTSTGHVIDMTSPPRLLRGGLDVGLDLPGSGNAVVGASIPGTHTFFTLNTAGDGLVRVDIYP
ncbi:MAG: hypothetical protein KC933_09180, partial [Myxococcales bacterium]|nr:hypothetical protein [Myxococcales bacterium]